MFGLRKSPPKCSILVLFGGSFDPPHRAHLEFARLIGERTPGTGVVMVPAARSPHKAQSPGAAGFERVAMLKRGLADVGLDPKGVWTIELDRGGKGPSYWVETLRQTDKWLKRQAAVEQLRFVIGSDQLAAFDRWHEAHEILRLARPIVLVRGDEDTPVGAVVDEATIERVLGPIRESGHWSDEELAAFADGFLVGQPIRAVSSTRVRTLLAQDRDAAELEELLTPGVLEYIRQRGLYRGPRGGGGGKTGRVRLVFPKYNEDMSSWLHARGSCVAMLKRFAARFLIAVALPGMVLAPAAVAGSCLISGELWGGWWRGLVLWLIFCLSMLGLIGMINEVATGLRRDRVLDCESLAFAIGGGFAIFVVILFAVYPG